MRPIIIATIVVLALFMASFARAQSTLACRVVNNQIVCHRVVPADAGVAAVAKKRIKR